MRHGHKREQGAPFTEAEEGLPSGPSPARNSPSVTLSFTSDASALLAP